MPVDLNFAGSYTPPAAGAVSLNFGGSTTTTVAPASVAVVLNVAAPVWQCVADYASNTSRPALRQCAASWQPAQASSKHARGAWNSAQTKAHKPSLDWRQAAAFTSGFTAGFGTSPALKTQLSPRWQQAKSAGTTQISIGFASLNDNQTVAAVLWGEGIPRSAVSGSRFVQLLPDSIASAFKWQDASAAGRTLVAVFSPGADFGIVPRIVWQQAQYPIHGVSATIIVQPPITGYSPSGLLNFLCKRNIDRSQPSNVLLNFGAHPCPDQGFAIPSKKVYFVINHLSLKRVSDNQPIDLLAASTATDKSSWCWSFSATIPYNQLDRIEPTANGPVEVELEINTLKWRFLVESYDQRRQFGKTDVSISGRSTTALLENPYAPVRSFNQSTATTSRQMAQAELVRAGLDTGFILDWQLIDALGWAMPANTWSYENLTPMQVIQTIAQGAGGFVNSHPLNPQLLVKPEYNAPYWDWASAAVSKVLPASVIKNQTMRWSEKPAYNGVYVSGENTGVTALVKRTGTAGDYQAPMFVSPMISHADAARSKGISILSAGGKQAAVGLDLPMVDGLGLITPGMLIEVTGTGGAGNAWRGMVNSTALSATWNNGLTVNQSIELERHFGGL